MSNPKYVDNQIKWLKKYFDTKIESLDRAVDKVEITNKDKFESQNEWRGQIKDQTSNFVTRRELWAAVVTIITLLISLAAIVYSKQ